MDWLEAGRYLDEAKSDIGKIEASILDSENRFRDPAAMDAVNLLGDIYCLIETAMVIIKRVSDETWQETP